jgi:hypothetical protein
MREEIAVAKVHALPIERESISTTAIHNEAILRSAADCGLVQGHSGANERFKAFSSSLSPS